MKGAGVLVSPGALLGPVASLADRLPLPTGRRQRRRWVGHGRAHIEVRGVHRPEHAAVARRDGWVLEPARAG